MYSNDNNTICFEGIQRVYRNSVVRHIRKVFKEKYPDDFVEKVKKPFQKEWDSIESNAQAARQSGEYTAELVDELDLLSVNHFSNLFEAYFNDLFPNAVPQSKQAIWGWARNIKKVRDPALGHPAELSITDEDAMGLLDSARRILENFDSEGSADLSKLWEEVRRGGQTYNPLEGSTLPSRESIAPRFIGRQTELKALSEWVKDPHSRVWLLAGDGGKGKTAIAYQFAVATQQAPPSRLEIVIWLSAKSRRFVEGQSEDIESPNFWDKQSALDWVLRAYGAIGFEGKSVIEKERECLDYLELLPALVILDDVDSLEVQNLDAMTFFTQRIHSTSSKFLLTSRRIPFGMQPMTTQVTGLGREDGVKFIDSRIAMFGLASQQFTAQIKHRILEACDGSPLFVQDLLRLCKVGETPDRAIRVWRREEGEAARRYALNKEFEELELPAQKVLVACAFYPGSISLHEIQVAANISEGECRSAIQRLQELFLIPEPPFIQDVPRFGLNINTRRLVSEVHGGTDLARRIKSSISVITGKSEATPAYRTAAVQPIRQAVSLVRLDKHQEAEETLLQALTLYQGNADLHGTLGWVYKSWKPQSRYTDATNQFARAADLKSRREETYRHWSDMLIRRSEWTSAAVAAERGLEVLHSSMELAYKAGLARSRLAQDLYQQAQYARAEQEALKAEAHLNEALTDLEDIETGQYQLHSQVHRAIVLNYSHLIRIKEAQQRFGRNENRQKEESDNFLRLLAESLDVWEKEHPDDYYVKSETQRLLYQHQRLIEFRN